MHAASLFLAQCFVMMALADAAYRGAVAALPASNVVLGRTAGLRMGCALTAGLRFVYDGHTW